MVRSIMAYPVNKLFKVANDFLLDKTNIYTVCKGPFTLYRIIIVVSRVSDFYRISQLFTLHRIAVRAS